VYGIRIESPSRYPVPFRENGQVTPWAEAVPVACIASVDPSSSPDAVPETVIDPPHTAEKAPDSSVGDSWSTVQLKFVQLDDEPSPGIDVQMPANDPMPPSADDGDDRLSNAHPAATSATTAVRPTRLWAIM
jgi:hypothetical protein